MKESIWDGINIGTAQTTNSIFRSATHEGMADAKGRPGEELAKLYGRLAEGGVGGIITGYCCVSKEGRSPHKGVLMLDSDDNIPSFVKMVDNVKAAGSPLFLQLVHCGRATSQAATGMPVVAPSPIRDKLFPGAKPLELTEPGIHRVISDFIQAGLRAHKCGFDGIQLHLAHGFLLSQFLSCYSNRRKDRWGGSIENRFRIVKEIIEGVKELLPDFPVMVKMNGYDHRKKGMRIEQAARIATLLEQSGCDAIEVSCGFPEDGDLSARGPHIPFDAVFQYHHRFRNLPSPVKKIVKTLAPLIWAKNTELRNYNVAAALAIKKKVTLPVIAIGGIHRLKDIEEAVIKKGLDGISLSRPLILEPGLIRKFREGKTKEARCKMCNYCGVLMEERKLRCYFGRLPRNFE